MIDSQFEKLLTLSAAAREVPNRRLGKGVNVSTVWRWTLRGIRGVKLETLYIGGTRFTSREALQRFFESVTVAATQRPSQPWRTTRQRERAIREAEEFLAKDGI